MNVKIISEGVGAGTKIVDAETGAPIQGVVAIDVAMRVDKVNTARVELHVVGLETGAVAEFYIADPASGEPRKVSKVVFADGDEWSAE